MEQESVKRNAIYEDRIETLTDDVTRMLLEAQKSIPDSNGASVNSAPA